ncbi:BTB/POZ and MATH domain-containing protein 3 [Dichanthelium oligosanthes]|uniref:BTB/POZ and MATH domain-containing protein 3 n=1 Tax=Dichanthelium oligosanthes TaxID=888268 RepID=A0A1E5VKI5_9POAL|nr:BTB/POZ and MATH domain-containing protein 3 [Dichanthelium oligosanthes]
MHLHIGYLLSIKEGADVKLQVGGEIFEAHRVVLGARSPVFMAELFGPMKEDDMEPRVFDALLTFMYTNTWPDESETEEEDACVMAQHWLVAADRYRLGRLKLMCEDRLLKHIDTDSAATILALAEQHCCPGLKEACFEFLGSSTALLAVIETEGFEYLAESCPNVMEDELISILLFRSLEKVNVSSGINCNLESARATGRVARDLGKRESFGKALRGHVPVSAMAALSCIVFLVGGFVMVSLDLRVKTLFRFTGWRRWHV